MKTVSTPTIQLQEFLELVIMWHCAGDIPMNRQQTAEFIECGYFAEFLRSVHHWADKLGVVVPQRADVIKTLHQLYNAP